MNLTRLIYASPSIFAVYHMSNRIKISVNKCSILNAFVYLSLSRFHVLYRNTSNHITTYLFNKLHSAMANSKFVKVYSTYFQDIDSEKLSLLCDMNTLHSKFLRVKFHSKKSDSCASPARSEFLNLI